MSPSHLPHGPGQCQQLLRVRQSPLCRVCVLHFF
jgi:hypothetical protein